jgi:branched-chain amino acid transport system substrate-binding protein
VAAAVAAAKSAGLATVDATFPATALDVTPQLDQLRSQSPDVLLYTSNGTQISALMKSRAKLGWNIPTIGDLGTGSGDIWQLAGGDAAAGTEAMVYPVQPYVDPSKRSKPLTELFAELQKAGVPPFTSGLTIYALAWDIMNLVNTAAIQANSIDAVKLTNALENLSQPSSPQWLVFKKEGFSKTVHFLAPPVTEFKVIKVGPLVDGMVKAP